MRFVVDTSALIAVINGEPEAESFHALLLRHEPLVSTGTLIETMRVVQVAGARGLHVLDRILNDYDAELVPVDKEQVVHARHGMLTFGKGRGEEPGVLNFGDLFAYALARQLALPLLFKGEDFARTDVTPLVRAG